MDDFSHSSHSTSVNDKVLKNERDIHLTAISFASNTAIAPVQLCTRANNSLIEETKPVDTFETMAIRSVDNVSITCQPTPYQNKVDIDDKECGVKNVPQDCTRLSVLTERGDHVETGNRIAPGMVSKWKRFCCHGIDHGRNLSTYPVFATGGCITSTAKVKMKISKTGASPNDPLDLTRDKTTQNSSVWKTGENVETAPKQNMGSKTKARTGAITSHEQSKIGIDVGKDIKEYGRVDVQSTGTDGLYPTVENTTCDIETNADVVSLARQDDMTPGCIKTTECKRMIVEYHNRKIIRHRIPLGIRIEAGNVSKPVNTNKICEDRINSACHISSIAGNILEDVHKRLIVVIIIDDETKHWKVVLQEPQKGDDRKCKFQNVALEADSSSNRFINTHESLNGIYHWLVVNLNRNIPIPSSSTSSNCRVRESIHEKNKMYVKDAFMSSHEKKRQRQEQIWLIFVNVRKKNNKPVNEFVWRYNNIMRTLHNSEENVQLTNHQHCKDSTRKNGHQWRGDTVNNLPEMREYQKERVVNMFYFMEVMKQIREICKTNDRSCKISVRHDEAKIPYTTSTRPRRLKGRFKIRYYGFHGTISTRPPRAKGRHKTLRKKRCSVIRRTSHRELLLNNLRKLCS